MKWVEALKAYAEKKGKYVVPKKGSAEYEEVRALMGGDKPKVEAKMEEKMEEKVVEKVEDPAKAKKAKKVKEVMEKMEKVKKERKAKAVVEAPSKRKVAKPRMKKAELEATAAAEAKPKRARVKREAGSVPAGMIPEGATKKAVMASKNPEAILQSATNAHLPIVGDEAVSLKLRAPRKLKEDDLPVLVDKEKVVDAKPFSFQALRNHLGA
jgi:hypothetical protein